MASGFQYNRDQRPKPRSRQRLQLNADPLARRVAITLEVFLHFLHVQIRRQTPALTFSHLTFSGVRLAIYSYSPFRHQGSAGAEAYRDRLSAAPKPPPRPLRSRRTPVHNPDSFNSRRCRTAARQAIVIASHPASLYNSTVNKARSKQLANKPVNPAMRPVTALAFRDPAGQEPALAQSQGRARPPRGLLAKR